MKRVFLVFIVYAAAVISVMQLTKFITRFEILQAANSGVIFDRDFYISIFGVTGVVLAFLLPAIGDRINDQKVFALGLAIGIVAAVSLILPIGSITLSVMRCLEGLAHVLIVTSGPGLIKRIAPIRFLPVVMSLWGSFFAVGFLAESFLGGILMDHVTPIIFTGLYGLAYLLCLAFFLCIEPACNDFVSLENSNESYRHASVPTCTYGLTFAFFVYVIFYIGWVSYPEFISINGDPGVVERFGAAAMIGNLFGLLLGALTRRYFPLSVWAVGIFLILAFSQVCAPSRAAPFLFILLGALPVLIYGSFPDVLHTQAQFVFASSGLFFAGNLGTFLAPQIFGSLAGRQGTPLAFVATVVTILFAAAGAAAMIAIVRHTLPVFGTSSDHDGRSSNRRRIQGRGATKMNPVKGG